MNANAVVPPLKTVGTIADFVGLFLWERSVRAPFLDAAHAAAYGAQEVT